MVPYEERQVAETGAYGAQRASRQPIAKRRELKFRPHKSAAGPRVTGLDRAIVPTGLNYEERERQGAEMVPYRAPERAVAKIPPVTATLAPAFVPPPPDVADEPSGWRSGDTPATMDARAVAIRGRSEKRFEKRQAQESTGAPDCPDWRQARSRGRGRTGGRAGTRPGGFARPVRAETEVGPGPSGIARSV